MEIEKLTQAEIKRIEKYTETIFSAKRSKLSNEKCELRDGYKDALLKAHYESKEYLKLFNTWINTKKKLWEHVKKYDMELDNYSEKPSNLSWRYSAKVQMPNERKKKLSAVERRIEKLEALDKEFKEQLIFGNKPKILEVIRKMEKI